jgi:N-acetylglucosamine-6-phosphate deacetylase
MRTVITAARLITPGERVEAPVVLVEDGRIAALGPRASMETPPAARRLDFPELTLAPGFIDVHIHGGAGHDVMEADASAIEAIQRHMVRHGVTSYLPTTVTAPLEDLLRALEHLGKAVAANGNGKNGARPLGIHLEGPFISHAKRGVHSPENLVQPSPQLLDRFWQASGGALRMMTIAPELPGALETIRRGQELGIRSSLGHSDASFEQTHAAITAGAVHATHTFNAMRRLDHRDPGITGAVLTASQLTADIIADGVHVDPCVVQLFLQAKGREHAVLITDAISAAGMGDGHYRLGPLEVEVRGNRCEYQGRLAGSVLTLDRAIRNVVSSAGWSLQDAVQLATRNPARLLGESDRRGVLATGCVADMVALAADGTVMQTMVAGEVVQP